MKISIVVAAFLIFCVFCLEYRRKKEYVLSSESSKHLKCLLAIFIILHHTSHRVSSSDLLSSFGCVGYIVVGMFFALSGYGLMKQYFRKKLC